MKDILVMILEIFAIIIAVLWTSGVIYLISRGRLFNYFFHNVMEWHLPDDKPQEFNGCSFHTHCKFCGKEIEQDSQGNWY